MTRRLLWCSAIWSLALAYGVGAETVATQHGVLTTYSGTSGFAAAAELAAGWALIAAGTMISSRTGCRRSGTFLILAGFTWFTPDWAGWQGGPLGVRTVGFLAIGIAYALVADVILSWRPDPSTSRVTRIVIAVIYAGTVVVAMGRALFRDPFEDPRCWIDCTSSNMLLAHGDRAIARALDTLALTFAIASAAAVVALVAWRLATATAPGRRRLWPVLGFGATFAALHAARATSLLGDHIEDPQSALSTALFEALCMALIGLAAGLAWELTRARRTRDAVARLAQELGDAPPPGALEAALRRALGDPRLQVGYWLRASERYVDHDGRPVDVALRADRTTTAIVRDGEPIAIVVHDAAAVDGSALAREIGAAARLAVDNERLQAEVRAQLVELRESRVRIVASTDAARRRLERDLHDGAQQRLLALSFDLRVARGAADADGDADVAGDLTAALAEASIALAELRELAHGIFPAVLEEAGLATALTTLAEDAPLAVELRSMPARRVSTIAERTVYVAVADAIVDAAARAATFVAVDVDERNGRLVVAVSDDGATRMDGLVQVADRVGALDGLFEIGPAGLHAEIPCG